MGGIAGVVYADCLDDAKKVFQNCKANEVKRIIKIKYVTVMKHIFSNAFNSEEILKTDKYYSLWNKFAWIWLISFLLVLILRLSIPDSRSWLSPVYAIAIFIFILTTVVIFIVRIVKLKVIDWTQILLSGLLLWVALGMINNAGGWSAVFSGL